MCDACDEKIEGTNPYEHPDKIKERFRAAHSGMTIEEYDDWDDRDSDIAMIYDGSGH